MQQKYSKILSGLLTKSKTVINIFLRALSKVSDGTDTIFIGNPII